MTGMETTTHTHEIGRHTVVHLAQDLSVSPVQIGPSFWNHDGDSIPAMSDGRILCVSDYSATWTWWERHPTGDELVYLISGDAEFLMETDSGSSAVALQPGHATVVPTGAWHRAVVRSPSRLLFVTPAPVHTEVRQVEGAAVPA
jgi:mannose-6-phosphate isomerase-like protein (cupin superfamily)